MRKIGFALIVAAISAYLWAQIVTKNESSVDFDYYVLALSWSPNWCKLEGDAKGSEQCDSSHDYGWTLHGLWPQFENGWPRDCPTSYKRPSNALATSMIDIMGSSGLAKHEWEKHGTCSNLSPEDYFLASREAFEAVLKPPVFREIKETVSLPAREIEGAFLQSNPQLTADQITITCKKNHLQEARVCLDKALSPRLCGADVILDCRHEDAGIAPIR
ncbi:ribonuclease T [Falsihalocynthiibacter sp. S25ZX9]|uniref:ribonuclease T2 family protein n=1 Tax=Falsihalocynthiibacter sp. S25ZX9 TaxID=3240870 RepID=UPI00350EAE3E